MRVIKRMKRAKCYHCGTLIEYEDSELNEVKGYDPIHDTYTWVKYLFCPVCKRKLVVKEVPIE